MLKWPRKLKKKQQERNHKNVMAHSIWCIYCIGQQSIYNVSSEGSILHYGFVFTLQNGVAAIRKNAIDTTIIIKLINNSNKNHCYNTTLIGFTVFSVCREKREPT